MNRRRQQEERDAAAWTRPSTAPPAERRPTEDAPAAGEPSSNRPVHATFQVRGLLT